ncbi:MAG: hypothetical protein AAFW89_13000 [Bacteroidota bacterium]
MSYSAQYYSPAQTASIADGGSSKFEFQGLSALAYAFNKINVGCDDESALNQIKASASLNQDRNQIFSNVHLLALRRLFELRSLHGGYLIPETRILEVTVENQSGATRQIGMDLNGYDGPQYEAKVNDLLSRDQNIPNPEFLYATQSIPANAVLNEIVINRSASKTRLHRIAVSTTSDANIQIAFKISSTTVIPLRFVAQLNAQFANRGLILPVVIPTNETFSAQVTNLDGVNAHEVSIICESYLV